MFRIGCLFWVVASFITAFISKVCFAYTIFCLFGRHLEEWVNWVFGIIFFEMAIPAAFFLYLLELCGVKMPLCKN